MEIESCLLPRSNTMGYLTAIVWTSLEHYCIEVMKNKYLMYYCKFTYCFFKKGCLLDNCSFICNAIICTDICQCKSCGNISTETNYDHSFNKKDVR